MPKLLAFAGSSREESFNKKLVRIAAAGARQAGAEVTLVDLGDFPMPIFNQDLESARGMPEKAGEFKELMVAHDGFLVASPEYNSSYSPLLKNAIDWASRSEAESEAPLSAFRGKNGRAYVRLSRRVRRNEGARCLENAPGQPGGDSPSGSGHCRACFQGI